MDKNPEEELQWMIDAGMISFSRFATFVDGPYVDQVKEVERYFKHITVSALDPDDLEKDGPVPVKTGDYELIEGSRGQYKWMGWK